MNSQTLYKIGGSLLDWPEFPSRLRLILQSDSQAVLMTGGGAAADAVRGWDRVFPLGEETAHDLALHSLTLTARLLTRLLPQIELASTPAQLSEILACKRTPVLLVHDWVSRLEPAARIPLRHDWQTTSDSVALWLAFHLQIPRLVLVKSTDTEVGQTPESAAEADLIDMEFPRLFRQIQHTGEPLTTEWINLRSESAPFLPSPVAWV